MSSITRLHDAVRGGDLSALTTLLAADPKLANARSETDPRGTYPLEDWRRCVELLQGS